MKSAFFTLMCVLLSFASAGALQINEFMPDPSDFQDRSEWIEVTTNENASLENITLDTGNGPVSLNGSLESGEFIIITKNATAFLFSWNSTAEIFESSKVKLSNAGDNISLYNGSELIHNIEYTNPETDKSYGLCGGEFSEQNVSTPGSPNLCGSPQENQTNGTNISENCDCALWIEADDVFHEDSNEYWLRVSGCGGISVEYWIEDLFGRMVKPRYITGSPESPRSWKPPETFGSEAYVIRANVTNITCNDTNASNNFAEKIVVVKGASADGPEEICEPEPCECHCPPCTCTPCTPEAKPADEKRRWIEMSFQPHEAAAGTEIKVELTIDNSEGPKHECEAYSYIYEGSRLLSLGFDGKDWVKEWSANKKTFNVLGDKSSIVSLLNRVDEGAAPGKYNIRSRTICDGQKQDITETISIIAVGEDIPPENPLPEDETLEAEGDAAEEAADEREIRIPTGGASSGESGNMLGEFLKGIINFFKNILNL